MHISTNRGDIKVTLNGDTTPCTVNSFLSLAKQGYFDDTKCHRLHVTQDYFVLQCGDPTGTGRVVPGYQFDDELSGQETYTAGTLAMANGGPNTNGSQFFIVYTGQPASRRPTPSSGTSTPPASSWCRASPRRASARRAQPPARRG